MTPSSVRAQRGLAAFLLGCGAWIMLTGIGHTGAARGALFGFGASGVVLGSALLWASLFTAAHLDKPPAYWQSIQDRWRSRALTLHALFGLSIMAVGGTVWATGSITVGAALLSFGAVSVAIAVAMVTGGIRPIRYE